MASNLNTQKNRIRVKVLPHPWSNPGRHNKSPPHLFDGGWKQKSFLCTAGTNIVDIWKICWNCVSKAGQNAFDKIVEIPVEELMQQFALLPVLPFRDWEEDVFQDLTVVPLVLIPSTSVTASWSKSQSQRSVQKYEKVKICNISQSPRRQNRKKSTFKTSTQSQRRQKTRKNVEKM